MNIYCICVEYLFIFPISCARPTCEYYSLYFIYLIDHILYIYCRIYENDISCFQMYILFVLRRHKKGSQMYISSVIYFLLYLDIKYYIIFVLYIQFTYDALCSGLKNKFVYRVKTQFYEIQIW